MKPNRCNAVWLCVAVIVLTSLLNGCTSEALDPSYRQFRCKGNVHLALLSIMQHNATITPVRAVGRAKFTWYEDHDKTDEETTDLVLRFVPPDRLFVRCDVLGQEIVRLGCNPQQFWFRVKPKEVSSFWYGAKENIEKCRINLRLNPYDFIEALGMISTDGDWTLDNRDSYDVLTKHDAVGTMIKRISIDCDGYLPRKIEYFDAGGQLTAVLELSDYTSITNTHVVPRRIAISYYDGDMLNSTADITLRNVRLFEPSQKQLQGKLFSRPDPTGYENIYELTEQCTFDRR